MEEKNVLLLLRCPYEIDTMYSKSLQVAFHTAGSGPESHKDEALFLTTVSYKKKKIIKIQRSSFFSEPFLRVAITGHGQPGNF